MSGDNHPAPQIKNNQVLKASSGESRLPFARNGALSGVWDRGNVKLAHCNAPWNDLGGEVKNHN